MAIFPILELEETVQQSDKTRLDASKSFVSDGAAISKIEIKPLASGSFIDVTTNGYLDWAYTATPSPDPQTITVEAKVTQGAGTQTVSKTISVISAAADKLYSTDASLQLHEPDILKYVPSGRSSFKNVHRRAQGLILAWLDKNGYVDIFGKKLTKANLVDGDELKEWSTFMVLRLIFEGISNAPDDIFSEKAKRYASMEQFHRERAILRLDINNDGVVSDHEAMDIKSMSVFRR